ncbi:uncharacterized protein M6B38_251195 [Iris pallida]|uniref:Reverse transcriptase domain-containing protein n=1 Tax=Iris pallida TaxID=29817 RepID=A0AAX6GDM5_IRIPA|nr:uncharacterized protein M6B38_371390 [Iris pallida]KAJ6853272.1 uncharacterized protein M6B38_251195 [Iris pallida]
MVGSNKSCMKLNLRKAYDTVNRDFVIHIMKAIGFDDWWTSRIYECISTPTFSIMVRGRPTGFIQSSRGLRQGDPLSAYLFTMVMEHFTCLMDIAEHSRKITPIFRLVKPSVSHLIYADNLLVFIKPRDEGIQSLVNILSSFEDASGLSLIKGSANAGDYDGSILV